MDITRWTDDNGLRRYTDGEVEALSVTTVLGFLEEDTTGLERWKAQNDGTGDSFDHEHIYWYSAPRGTLAHYQALSKFEGAFENTEMWGEEETASMEQIENGPEEGELTDASTDLHDITYSIMKNQETVADREQYEAFFADTELVEVLQSDLEYFVDAFDTVCTELGVTEDSVIHVEKFMLNGEDGFGGQCDMVYEDVNGNVVVADLKTSSGLRQKHRLQSVAYMKAVEKADGLPNEVDRIEVWRIDPDAEVWQVHSHEVPEHVEHLYDENRADQCAYTDANWFDDKWGSFSYDSIEDMWETFQSLTTEAHEQAA